MQKTGAQNIEFWQNGGHFRDNKKSQKFLGCFRNFIEFCFDFGLLDIAFNAYTKFQGQTTT